MSKSVQAHIALLCVNVLYGASHVIAKGVMPTYLSPNVFILFRVVGATSLFWLVKQFLPKETVSRKDYLLLAASGLFGITINQLCFFHGLNLSSSINSGIIITLNPIMVVIFAYFWLKEPITKNKVVGIVLGAAGALLLTLRSNHSSSSASIGDILLFVNAFSYAVYLVIAKPLMQKYSPLVVTTYVFTFGMLFVLLFPPTLMDLSHTDFSIIPFDAWMKISYVIVGVTFFTYLLTMVGLKYLSASISSGYIYTQPVLVMLFAFLFAAMGISEDYTNEISVEKILYMLLIFAGVYILSKKVKLN